MDLLVVYLLTLTDWLDQADRELFTLIHSTASSPHVDWLMKLLRNQFTWIPLYAFILYWLIRYHRKYAWQIVVMTLVTFALTDHISAALMKPYFGRIRPCYDEALQPIIRDLVGCGGQYGMPSTHASNHFGLSSFWFFTITWMSTRRWWWLWIWAVLVCYAQIYVGKHYPGDILVGALFGGTVGLLMALLLRRLTNNYKPQVITHIL